ncbi:nucleotidyl transferase AbiEii/AbiGii toxin family protein, partial [Candidatus Bipolaricaulota bacterium]|nr:nucleotidyl transferase AbiEii/AbiGii toxin family protein [Candidatus Bipolaricaulota bacterium]
KRVRPEIEDAMERVFQRSDLSIVSKPTDSHSASQWILNYNQATRGKDSIKVDLNYLRRVSILEPQNIEPSNIGSFEFKSFPVLDINELAAGKLKALFERNSSKDLYDVHKILNKTELEEEKLRVAFVVYGGSSRQDWRNISLENLDFKYPNMKNTLFDMLRGKERNQLGQLREDLTDSVKKGLSVVLPFQDSEKEFLRKINLEGEIKPSLITEDSGLQNKIRKDPALQWKVKNVKEHYGLN